jgi:hypothetical protein
MRRGIGEIREAEVAGSDEKLELLTVSGLEVTHIGRPEPERTAELVLRPRFGHPTLEALAEWRRTAFLLPFGHLAPELESDPTLPP